MNLLRSLSIFLSLLVLTSIGLISCASTSTTASGTTSLTPTVSQTASICPVTEPVWLKPADDSAVQGSPGFGYYFANKDRSILASAWWAEQEEYLLHANEEGIKVGWFRPAGATLEITGERIDGQAPPLEADVPCCYPTRFQATGLAFPTEGCWEVIAKAADSELSFIIWVEPET